MKTTVNERVISLKKHFNFSDAKFCGEAGISTGTLHRIKHGEEVSDKTITSICDAFGASREWLLHGVGEMLTGSPAIEGGASWMEKAFDAVKDENDHLKQEVQWLRSIMTKLTGAPNFLNGIGLAGRFSPVNTVRVAV